MEVTVLLSIGLESKRAGSMLILLVGLRKIFFLATALCFFCWPFIFVVIWGESLLEYHPMNLLFHTLNSPLRFFV